jgi:formamidopyrimidine-DNA glycosylase
LEKEVIGRRIVGATITNTKVLKGQAPDIFNQRVQNTRIESVGRRGKYLLLSLVPISDSPVAGSASLPPPVIPQTLCVHLKMRGQLLIRPADEPPGAYHCISLLLEDNRAVCFHDMWTWGEMRVLTESELATVAGLKGMGPEPLESEWNGGALATRFAKRSGPVKVALLDQTNVAGVGNIYADESLFRAGIHPQRKAGDLTPTECDQLAIQIRAVLSEAVGGGGTTSEDYVDINGTAGRYTPDVYGRGGQPCVRCETPLTRIRLGGRGTVFCAVCQPPSENTK